MDLRSIALNIYQKSLDSSSSYQGLEEDTEGLSSQDKAFIKRLVLTALRKQEFLKKTMRKYMTKNLPPKLALPHLIIILAAVEILYFSTPDYAVLNSYVDIAKKKDGKYSSGFVNAVLRKITKDKYNIAQNDNNIFFPRSFNEILKSSYTSKQISQIEKAAALEPPLDLTVKSNPELWAEKLDGKLMGNGSVRIFSAGPIPELSGFAEGEWWVQDLASSLAVESLDNLKNKTVLDLCAAPGGKTAQLIIKGAKVTALDISEPRLQRLAENLHRLNLSAENIITADAIEYLKNCDTEYDIIVIDAPCSATGTLRRHPEIVHTKTLNDVKRSTNLQKQMLNLAAQKLKKDGIMVYAVCSLSKSEGEKLIKSFLDANQNFSVQPILVSDINPYNQQELNELITSEGYIRCLPSHLSTEGGLDGFFVAKLKKGN